MKDMKSYLSEQLLLCHIGKDEKQTENVHAMLKKYLALWFLFVLKGMWPVLISSLDFI